MSLAIKGEGFAVTHDAALAEVRMQGSLRLNGMEEYLPVLELLRVASAGGGTVVIDLSELEFLNSSGIATLSKFVIESRNRQIVDLLIRGSRAVPWQGKSLVNLQRLMPALRLEIT